MLSNKNIQYTLHGNHLTAIMNLDLMVKQGVDIKSTLYLYL